MRPSLFRRFPARPIDLFCFVFLLVPPLAAGGWPEVMGGGDWSEEERAGAGFLAENLTIEDFEALSPEYQHRLLRYAADHRDGEPKLVLCWSEDTPMAIVKAFHAVEEAGARVRRENHRPAGVGTAYQFDPGDHWHRTATNGTTPGAQGEPVTLTWSIVPDNTVIPGGQVGGEAMNEGSDLRAWLAGLYGGSSTGPAADQPWFAIFQAVFDNIGAQTGLRYVYEPNDDGWNGTSGTALSGTTAGQGVLGVRGDIRISGHALDGNGNVLAYNYFPDFSDMVIDTSDNFFSVLSNNSRRLRNVIEHEHGHGLGLSHVCPLDNTKLMEPFVNLTFTGIQFDEVLTLQRLYGDPAEVNGTNTNNDVFARATPLSTPVNVPYVSGWLGIDDNSDLDHYRFTAPADSQLSVRLIPSAEAYLEGPQNPSTGNCTAGTPFDSTAIHDLSFELIGSDQTTVLATANSEPAGVMEAVEGFVISQSDDYYVRVRGGSADFNQLYRLEVDVGAPSVLIQLVDVSLGAELFEGANGAPDPGETVRLDIELANVGLLEGTRVAAQLVLPAGSQGFDLNEDYGDLASGASATRSFVFAPAGNAGDTLGLELQVTADGGVASTIAFPLTLGFEQSFFAESFDATGSLPAGWTSADVKKGSGWSVVSNASFSAPRSAFAANPSQAGSSTLTSPVVSVADSPGSLSFRHHYDTEPGWDGGVLEIRIGTGDWQDITAAGGIFLTGGYNLALDGVNNPLRGRSGWSGDSGSFVETRIALPPSVVNQDVQFRWILGHDVRVGAHGWYLDDVIYRSFIQDASEVALSLSSGDAVASELADPADPAEVRVSAVLPVPGDFPVTLQATGSVDPLADLVGFGNLLLTTGNASVTAPLTAVADGVVEGNETLEITSPDAAGTVELTIVDSPYGLWAAGELGLVGAIGPFDDFDGDGSPNVEELINGTDGASAASRPRLQILREGADFKLPVPLQTLPLGVLVDAEASGDLSLWTTDGITRLGDGFLLDGGGNAGFIRVLYEMDEGP